MREFLRNIHCNSGDIEKFFSISLELIGFHERQRMKIQCSDLLGLSFIVYQEVIVMEDQVSRQTV